MQIMQHVYNFTRVVHNVKNSCRIQVLGIHRDNIVAPQAVKMWNQVRGLYLYGVHKNSDHHNLFSSHQNPSILD